MTDTGLNNYLDEIGRQQLLSDEQERELSERILRGDERVVSQLVEANLRFVVKLAAQYRGQGLQMDDLVSEGNTANLENMTFLEFMAKLDRLIDKYEKEAKAAKERAESIKNHKHYARK